VPACPPDAPGVMTSIMRGVVETGPGMYSGEAGCALLAAYPSFCVAVRAGACGDRRRARAGCRRLNARHVPATS